MIEEARRPNPKSRGERTRRRLRYLNFNNVQDSKSGKIISPISISPTKNLIHLENQRNNNVTDRPNTLPKRKNSFTQLLKFGKKNKAQSNLSPSVSFQLGASRDTLTEDLQVAELNEEQEYKKIVEEKKPQEEQVLDSTTQSPLLRNSLRAASVIELNEECKKTAQQIKDEYSRDSLNSTESPELRNWPVKLEVDARGQGSVDSDSNLGRFTDSAFTLFHESEFVKQLSAKPKKKSLWRKLIRKSGDSSQGDQVADGVMSQSQAPSRNRIRGRGASTGKKLEKGERLTTPEPSSPTKTTPPPLMSLPSASNTPTSVAPTSTPQPSKDTKRISGDDLRKQLSEGLKNGSGKSKDAAADKSVKAQLSEITEGAVKTSADETKSFIEKEKQSKEGKEGKENAGGGEEEKAQKKDDKKSEETKTEPAPVPSAASTSDIITPPAENKKEHLYKILVIGELGTGKTSIIKRYVHQFFSQHYRATIGVDFALKVLNWDENSIIRLQLWDIAGQERFGNMTRVYYKEAVGAFIVFDVTRSGTFDAVQKWKQDLDSKVQLSDGSPIPCILLANKCDQPKEGTVNSKSKMDDYCRDNGFEGWFETSAKDNINIEEAARALVVKILQNDKLIRTGDRRDEDKIALDGSYNSPEKSCSC